MSLTTRAWHRGTGKENSRHGNEALRREKGIEKF